MMVDLNRWFSVSRPFARSAAYVTAARFLSTFARAVYSIVLARVLGPALYGTLIYAQAWYLALLPFALFEIDHIIAREIGRDRKDLQSFLSATLVLRLATALVTAVALVAIAALPRAETDVSLLFGIFAVGLTARALCMWADQVFIGFAASQHALHLSMKYRVGEVVGGSALLLLYPDAILAATVHAASWCLQALSSLNLVRRHFARFTFGWESGTIRSLLLIGVPLTASAVLSTFILQGPLILAEKQVAVGAHSLGQLAIAFQLLMMAMAIPWSIGAAALPFQSRAAARAKQLDVALLTTGLQVGILASFAACLLAQAVLPVLIPLLLGSDYAAASQFAALALWCLVPLTITVATTNALTARGNYRALPLAASIGVASLLVSHGPLTTAFGLDGNLYAALVGSSSWALALSLTVSIGMRLPWLQGLIGPIGVGLIATAIYVMGSAWISAAGVLAGVTVLGVGFLLLRAAVRLD